MFNAITKQAVTEAMKNPREIDGALVDAYLARRALDYLVGFTLSPVLWRKLPGARSAGRVQSVALRLVCDRELEIEKFVAREYWSLVATLATPRGETFEARLVGADGKKIQRLDIGTGAEAEAVQARPRERAVHGRLGRGEARQAQSPAPVHHLDACSRRRAASSASRPRIRCASRSGSMRASRSAARPSASSPICVPTASTSRRRRSPRCARAIASNYGKEYVPDAPRLYQNKPKNAQEAHEAVRPTDATRRPRDVAKFLDADQAKLYELIWQRAIASQMESAELERTTVDIAAKVGGRTLDLRATGTSSSSTASSRSIRKARTTATRTTRASACRR